MEANVILIANTVIGGLLITVVGLTVAWMRTRERAIRAELGRQRPPLPDEARLERLQQSVDAVALEVERIAEAQRFAAKVLAEQSPRTPALAPHPVTPPPTVTPH